MTTVVQSGKIVGESADLYPDYAYSEPIAPPPASHILHLDPARLKPDSYYPRSDGKPGGPAHRTRRLLDYEVEMVHLPTAGETRVTVILKAGPYTAARRSKHVEVMRVPGYPSSHSDVAERAIESMFRDREDRRAG